MTWKSGDQALIQTCNKAYDDAGVNGKSCTLIKFLGNQKDKGQYIIKDCWLVFVHEFRECYVSEHCLRRPYDGNQPTSWEQLEDIWQPSETVM